MLIFKKILPTIVLLLIWQICSMFINKLFLPAPIDVYKMITETLKSGLLLQSLGASFWRITLATIYSTIIAFLIGIAVINSKTLEKAILPITNTIRYIPVTVFYPLLIMWLGIGETMKVTFLFIASFMFFLPTTIQAFEDTDKNLIEVGQVLGMSKLKITRHIIIKNAAPTLTKSFLMMYAIGWTYVIVAESINTTKGLGYLKNIGTARGKTDLVFTAILTIVLINFLIDFFGNKLIDKVYKRKKATTKGVM